MAVSTSGQDAHDVEKQPELTRATSTTGASVKIVPNTQFSTHTRRGLSLRHVQLILLASGVGVGLWVGIGGKLRDGGPANVLLGYAFYGLLFIWPVSLQVGELAAWLPIRGSIYELASRFVDPALGFAMGWTYFFAGTMIVCAEHSAVATLIQYWDDKTNPAVWVAVSIVFCFCLNIAAVRWFGEAEFILASTKVLLLLGLVMITFITMVGGNPNKDAYGFRNFTDGNAMHSYYATGATGRFLGFWTCARYAVFTIGGPDVVALTAGEIRDPRRSIPKIAKMVFYRLVGFYIIGVLAVGIICPSKDARLLGAIDAGAAGAAASPWVIGIANVGITGGLPSLINALILLSGLSCGNGYLYSSSRTLYSLAQDAQAPKIFLRCTKHGVPWVCVTAVTVISFITFLVASNATAEVFDWFVSLTSCALVANFTAMSWVFVAWCRAFKTQGLTRKDVRKVDPLGNDSAIAGNDILLPYRSPFAPYTGYLTLAIGTIISVSIVFDTFAPFSVQGFITSYFGIVWFWLMFVVWKVIHKTQFVKPAEVDIYAGGLKQAVDDECAMWDHNPDVEPREGRLRRLVRRWGRSSRE